jgi:hypothetical protein
MSARDLLDRLLDAGLRVDADDRGLIVKPAVLLTGELRDDIRRHRDGLMVLVRGPDPRVRCLDCKHHRPDAYRCANYRAAGLQHPDVSGDLAELRQDCPGHAPRAES